MCVKRQSFSMSSSPVLGAACAFALALLISQSAHAQLDNAPTINALSQLQRVEIEKAAQKRMDQLNPPPPAPTVAVEAPVVKVQEAPKPKPVITKTILAIYGRQGSETAEIEMPDGSIAKVVAGQRLQDFTVVSVGNGLVVIERAASEVAKKAATRRQHASQPSTSRKHTSSVSRAVPVASQRVYITKFMTGDKFD